MLDIISQIKNTISISQVVERAVALKQCGNGEMVGLCPFHQEKTPSFTVSIRKGFYHCFGCGAHGDIISFIQQMHGLRYMNAIERLAQEAGIDIPKFSRHQNEKFKTYFQILEETTKFYSRTLFEPIGREALEYLMKRGVSNELISMYRIGFAPDSKKLDSILGAKFKEQDILKSGVLRRGTWSLYNPMQGRIIFPITNITGAVLAFGGRKISDAQQGAKYINSIETEVFHKGKILWGLHHADRFCRQNKVNNIIIVEGYMDVVALANAGHGNAVASLGTSLKLQQIEKIWRYGYNPILCLDSDIAGRKATAKLALELLKAITPNYNVKILSLGSYKDPDEYLTKKGIDSYKQLIENAHNLSDYLFAQMLQMVDSLNSPENRSLLKSIIADYAAKIAHRDLQSEYKRHWLNLLWKHTKESNIIDRAKSHIKIDLNYKINVDRYIIVILSALFQYPELLSLPELFECIMQIRSEDPNINIVLDKIMECEDNIDGILEFKNNVTMDLEVYEDLSEAQQAVNQAMIFHQIQIVKQQIANIALELNNNPNEKDVVRLQHLRNYIQQLYNKISAPL